MLASILSWNTLVTTLHTIQIPENQVLPVPVNKPWLVKISNLCGQLNYEHPSRKYTKSAPYRYQPRYRGRHI